MPAPRDPEVTQPARGAFALQSYRSVVLIVNPGGLAPMMSAPNPRELDPREVVDKSAMTVAQIAVVAITVLLNAMDGFDILSIAFASPGIAKEWGVAPLALGIVLSMELIGMAFGSVFLGG